MTEGTFTNATTSVFHQHHLGRVLRSSCRFDGRRIASLLGREPCAGRRINLWQGNVRIDGGRVAAGGDGSAAWVDDRLDGALRPDDGRGEEVRRVEHPG